MDEEKDCWIVIGDNNSPINCADPGEDSDSKDDGFVFKICTSPMASRTIVYTLLANGGVRKGTNFKQRQAKKQKKKKRVRAFKQRKWKKMRTIA